MVGHPGLLAPASLPKAAAARGFTSVPVQSPQQPFCCFSRMHASTAVPGSVVLASGLLSCEGKPSTGGCTGLRGTEVQCRR